MTQELVKCTKDLQQLIEETNSLQQRYVVENTRILEVYYIVCFSLTVPGTSEIR